MSERAVEIPRNKAESEVAPIRELASSLRQVKEEGGSEALRTYFRHMRIPLLERARSLVEPKPSIDASHEREDV